MSTFGVGKLSVQVVGYAAGKSTLVRQKHQYEYVENILVPLFNYESVLALCILNDSLFDHNCDEFNA